MSQVLPPVRTAGQAGAVGLSVAAAFGGRRAAPAPAVATPPRPAPVVEDELDEAEWDPRLRRAVREPLPRLTLAEVWAAQEMRARQTPPAPGTAVWRGVGEDAADWDPEDVPRATPLREAAQLSGASLAAGALSRMVGGGR